MRSIALLAAPLVVACASPRIRAPNDEVQVVPLNGVQMAYAIEGSGPPLVIIHGAWGDYRSFARAVPALAERHSVVRVSLRYHFPGQPPASRSVALGSYTVPQHVTDVVALVEHLGRGPVVLLGHSYGGVIAAHVAASRPDLVRRLVLVEASLFRIAGGEKGVEEYKEWAREVLGRIGEQEEPLAVARAFHDDERPGTFESLPEIRRSLFLANARTVRLFLADDWVDVPFTCADAGRLAMPVLLVEGEKTDDDVRLMNTRLLGCLADARRVVLPGAGHRIQFDAPEAMARAVVAFTGG